VPTYMSLVQRTHTQVHVHEYAEAIVMWTFT